MAVEPIGEQVRVVECRDRRVLVLGGPGTGKTAIALETARRILLEADPGKRVLFLTFSRAATTEILERAPSMLSGSIGGRIDVNTFHSFAVGVMNGFRRYADGGLDPVAVVTEAEEKLGLVPQGGVTFNELVPQALDLLRSVRWAGDSYKESYAAVICDEFQDTRDNQADLLEFFAESGQIIALADPDQMIYDFIDPSVRRRIEAFRRTGPTEIDIGTRSFRDPSQLLPDAARSIRDGDLRSAAIRDACEAGRLRLRRITPGEDTQDVLVAEIKDRLVNPTTSVGVFLQLNAQVNDLAERLRNEGIEHEIAGLAGASGEAELATATIAQYLVGAASLEDIMRRLAVFLTAATRSKNPPELALRLVQRPENVPEFFRTILDRELTILRAAGDQSTRAFLESAHGLWSRMIRGRGQRLWELGIDDLVGQTLEMARAPLDQARAQLMSRVAASRRGSLWVDALPGVSAPVRLMNVYQIKGREMDFAYLVNSPDDIDFAGPLDRQRLERVHYVALTRARDVATVILAEAPNAFWTRYEGLCA
jgi:DNA helicase II / ATP-dependent DNA helicase PcrA